MASRLLNKVAVITASTDGIGLAIAQRFLKEGSKVVISSRKLENVNYSLKILREDFKCTNVMGLVCNVGIKEDRERLIQETIKRFGNIDILVSNAATNINIGPSIECSEEKWDKILDTNLKSTFFLTKEAFPHFNKNASIIFMSSIAGFIPLPLLGIYCITKTALIGMVKVLSLELAASSLAIRVNGIAPGLITTKFSRVISENKLYYDDFIKMTHLKRPGTTEECASLVAFLASDEASYITGETITVCGGYPTRL